MPTDDGWETYSRMVLQQLETLSAGIEQLRVELQSVKSELVELKAREDRIQEIKTWKEKMDDVVSPTQLKEALSEFEELKLFKTKAITAFAVIQFVMASVLAALAVL
jgi:seryl-tRNA synthetase